MTDQQAVTKGYDSQNLLDNPAYREAMQLLRDDVIAAWKDCPVRDKEGQTLLLQLIKLTDKFEGLLNGMVANGKIAAKKIEMDNLRNESKPERLLRKAGFR